MDPARYLLNASLRACEDAMMQALQLRASRDDNVTDHPFLDRLHVFTCTLADVRSDIKQSLLSKISKSCSYSLEEQVLLLAHAEDKIDLRL